VPQAGGDVEERITYMLEPRGYTDAFVNSVRVRRSDNGQSDLAAVCVAGEDEIRACFRRVEGQLGLMHESQTRGRARPPTDCRGDVGSSRPG
jgi:hypothetical protein